MGIRILGLATEMVSAELGVPNVAFVADGKLMAAFRASASEDGPPVLCLHALTESMDLRALPIVRLERTFWHCVKTLIIKRVGAESNRPAYGCRIRQRFRKVSPVEKQSADFGSISAIWTNQRELRMVFDGGED